MIAMMSIITCAANVIVAIPFVNCPQDIQGPYDAIDVDKQDIYGITVANIWYRLDYRLMTNTKYMLGCALSH